MTAKVIEKCSNQFVLKYDNEIIKCSGRGKIKLSNNIMVGDNVEIEKINEDYVIKKILNRKNFLIRPPVANIDFLIIIQSVKNPDFSPSLLVDYLAYYEYLNISNIIIFLTKIDLLTKDENDKLNEIILDFKKDNYLFFNYDKNYGLKSFNKIFKNKENKLFCFCGQSGVGKSTLINKLIPNLNLTTNVVSKNINRGKHTTTTIKLYEYKKNYIADTPGFSSLKLNLTKKEYANSFYNYHKLSEKCFFNDCLHINEKECFVIKHSLENKISQIKYNEYLKTIKKLK